MNNGDILKDLSHIRNLMENSTKFISISGLSGILMGVYTLLAISFLFYKLNITVVTFGPFDEHSQLMSFSGTDIYEARRLYIYTAILLLVISLTTGLVLAKRKAKKSGQNIWNPTSKALLLTISGPLITGGLFVIIGAISEVYQIIIPSFLIFYGLALFSGGAFTFKEIRVLGLLQIVLGLLAFMYSNWGLIFFGLGFGVLHIIYGILILKKHGA
jgi:hypothetical protein